MNKIVSGALAGILFVLPLRGEESAAEGPTDSPKTGEQNETPAQAEVVPPRTNTPPPALVGVALVAATGAWILSGVDWTSDDEDLSAAVLPAPSLTAPEADAEIAPGPVAFRWKSVKDAASYLLDIDRCGEPGTCADFRLERVVGTSFTIEWPADAPAGRWRVRAVDADNIAGRWSEFRSFTRAAPTP